MHDFVHDKTWAEYCDELARDGIWGDHLTLSAAAEVQMIGRGVSIHFINLPLLCVCRSMK